MRHFIAGLVIAFLAVIGASCVGDRGARPQAGAEADLDDLFRRLQATRDADEAERIEVAIRQVWLQSGRGAVDSLVEGAMDAIHTGDYEAALANLDRVVDAAPAYVEGWNLRATVHYLRDDYAEALYDIEHVLAIEPRHFGALAGLGHILLEMEEEEAALAAFEAALALNPHLADVRDKADEVRELMAGVPI